jgi:hypothetical protein
VVITSSSTVLGSCCLSHLRWPILVAFLGHRHNHFCFFISCTYQESTYGPFLLEPSGLILFQDQLEQFGLIAAHLGPTIRFHDIGNILADEGAALFLQNVATGHVSSHLMLLVSMRSAKKRRQVFFSFGTWYMSPITRSAAALFSSRPPFTSSV